MTQLYVSEIRFEQPALAAQFKHTYAYTHRIVYACVHSVAFTVMFTCARYTLRVCAIVRYQRSRGLMVLNGSTDDDTTTRLHALHRNERFLMRAHQVSFYYNTQV